MGSRSCSYGEVMGNLAKGFEERQFNEDLTELEKLVDEIKSLQDQAIKAAKYNKAAEEKPATNEMNQEPIKLLIPDDPVVFARDFFGFDAKEYQAGLLRDREQANCGPLE